MRLRTLILCSTSMALFAGAAPALAEAPQDTPGTEAAAVQTDETEEPSITVTGIRRSLQSSQAIKRNATQQIDSIVADDIGKLPDIAVSDTAARIVGVQVDRGGGEAGRVLVRGLPDFSTTYNGREIFTAETRVVALQDFPSGAIGAVEVFKTTTSDLVEAGLAGQINVRSRRAFDFDGFEVAGTVYGLYTKQSNDVTPNGNILITDRWDTGIGEIGALVSASYTRLHYLDSSRSNTDFVADPTINGQRVRFPDIQRLTYGEGDRDRPSANASLQWRPSPGLEFYVDALWQGFRNRLSDREMTVPLWGGASYNNFVLRQGTNELQSGQVVNPFRPDGFQGGTFNKTDTYQFAVGGKWESDAVKVSADVARTDSTFTGSTASVDYALANQQTVNFNLDVGEEDGGAEFDLVNFDASLPANYIYRGFYEEAQQAKGQDWQARLDVSYEPGLTFLPKIQAGVRFVDRTAHREFGNRYWNFEGNRIPVSDVPLDYELFEGGFRGSDVQPFRRWLSPTYSSIRRSLGQLRRFNMALGGTAFGFASDDPPPADPMQTYDANEKSYAAYGQINYLIGDESGFYVDGAIGVRAVKTELTISGTSSVQGVQTPVEIDRSYTDWLPNASARIHLTDRFQLRLSATRTRTRPNFAQLNPSSTLGPPASVCAPGATDPYTCARSGGGGNPFLNPFTSDNYDASAEYYFSPTGFVAAAVFRRDLNGFFQNLETRYIDPTLGPLILNAPVNSGKGRIDGAEAQISTFLDFAGLPEWAHRFGIQANVTYLDAKTGFPNGTGVFTLDKIVGVSDWTYNVAGIYEGGGLSMRLSYNHRSSFVATRQDRGNDIYREIVRPIGRLDFSSSYDLTPATTVFFDWTNILEKPFQSDLFSNRDNAGEVTFPRVVRFEESTMSLGVRFRF